MDDSVLTDLKPYRITLVKHVFQKGSPHHGK